MNLMQQAAVAASQANTSGVIGSGMVGAGSGGGQQPPIGGHMPQHLQNLHQQQVAAVGRNPLFGRENRQKMGDSLLSPNTFDPSEFPSLGANSTPTSALSTRHNYVGMVKQPQMESSEFTMSHEDFPALPGSNPVAAAAAAAAAAANQLNSNQDPLMAMGGGMHPGPEGHLGAIGQHGGIDMHGGPGGIHERGGGGGGQSVKKGIQTSPDGTVKNIPPSMVTDQFGMIGLLTFIRAAETDPNLVSLALGADLTTLGLNLNSEVNLYPTFGGPWADTPCRPQDIDFHVPHEYLTNQTIREKLAPVKLNRYKDDVLFYMFYTNVGDVLQLAAAAELYTRDWRYHRDDRVWITRAPGMVPSEKTNTYERGTYYFFDVQNWRKVSKEFHLDYDKLEDRPSLPQQNGAATAGNAPGNSTAGTGASSATNGPPLPNAPPQPQPTGPSPVMQFGGGGSGPVPVGPGGERQHSPAIPGLADNRPF